MAKQATANAKPGPIMRLQEFLREVRVELSKVTWPTMDDLKVSTKVTMYMLLIMAFITYAFDWVFARVILVWLGLFG